ncbi:signal peptidase II [Mangrovicella endophytica]|uniref:signal peptidase II n=1 Tax=Mangrovicella endophytica TaxID=2066697 RepID=UPI000C9EAEA1|nr:signal peptidase II [Mangrovicella endophytica]
MNRLTLLRDASIVALAVASDQLIKAIVVRTMALGEAIELLPFLALYHARNEGIAFSMFAGLGDVGLSLVALVVLALVGWLWWKTPRERTLTHIGFAVIVGGAIGNLIDRTRLGYVVDYVYFHTPVWSFAVVNLADAFITVGAALILLDEFILARRDGRAAAGSS